MMNVKRFRFLFPEDLLRPASQRMLEGISPITPKSLPRRDRETLKDMGDHVQTLHSWLQTLTPCLTATTRLYLEQLTCLGE